MISRGQGFWVMLLLLAFGAAGCSSSPMSRIDANRALYESWPFDMQEAILNGRVVAGMTAEMVKMSIGEPTEIHSRSGRNGEEEVWTYRKGGGLGSALSNTNISMGGSMGGVGIGSGIPIGSMGGGNNSNAEEHDVVFQKGVVVRSDVGS